jgi:hypothetical protein
MKNEAMSHTPALPSRNCLDGLVQNVPLVSVKSDPSGLFIDALDMLDR